MLYDFLEELGIKDVNYGATLGNSDGWVKTKGKELVSYSPIDGKPIAKVVQATKEDYDLLIREAQEAFKKWKILTKLLNICGKLVGSRNSESPRK